MQCLARNSHTKRTEICIGNLTRTAKMYQYDVCGSGLNFFTSKGLVKKYRGAGSSILKCGG